MDVEYGAIDVLPALQPLREVTTEISDWQTFPQLYVNGELLGGADIIQEMFESGELAEALGVEQPEAVAAAPAARQRPPGAVPAAADRISLRASGRQRPEGAGARRRGAHSVRGRAALECVPGPATRCAVDMRPV